MSTYMSSDQIAALIEEQNQQFAAMGSLTEGGDPRISGVMRTQQLVMQAVSAAPDYIAGGATLAAEFGYGPSIISPWSGTIGAARQGFAAAGLAGGIGAGAAAFGGYMAAGSAINNLAMQPFRQGVQLRGLAGAQMSQMLPGMSASMAGDLGTSVASMGMGMGATPNDTFGVLSSGIARGQVDTSSISSFQSSFQQLLSQVQSVAMILRTSLTQGAAALGTMQDLGLGSGEAMSAIMGMRMYGQSGLSPGMAFGAVQQGIGMADSLGSSRLDGALGALSQAATFSQALHTRAVPGMTAGASGQFQMAAQRFLGSRHGGYYLAAMMDEQGGMNHDIARQISSGMMSGEEIRALGMSNMSGNRDMFMSSRSELAGEYLSTYGASSTIHGIRAMTEGRPYGRSEALSISGLTNAGLEQMEQYENTRPMLEARVKDAARQAFKEGTGNVSIGAVINAVLESSVLGPIKRRMRDLGMSVSRSVTEAVQAFEEDVYGDSGFGGMSASGAPGLGAAPRATMQLGGSTYANPSNSGLGMYVPMAAQLGGMSSGTTLLDLPGFGLFADSRDRDHLTDSLVGFGAAGMGIASLTGFNPLVRAGTAMHSFGMYNSGLFGGGGVLGGSARFAGGLVPRFLGRTIQAIGKGLGSKPAALAGLLYAGVTLGVPSVMGALGRDVGTRDITGTNARALLQLNQLKQDIGEQSMFTDNKRKAGKYFSVSGSGKTISKYGVEGLMALQREVSSMSPNAVRDAFGGGARMRDMLEKTQRLSNTQEEMIQYLQSEGIDPMAARAALAKRGLVAEGSSRYTSEEEIEKMYAALTKRATDTDNNFATFGERGIGFDLGNEGRKVTLQSSGILGSPGWSAADWTKNPTNMVIGSLGAESAVDDLMFRMGQRGQLRSLGAVMYNITSGNMKNAGGDEKTAAIQTLIKNAGDTFGTLSGKDLANLLVAKPSIVQELVDAGANDAYAAYAQKVKKHVTGMQSGRGGFMDAALMASRGEGMDIEGIMSAADSLLDSNPQSYQTNQKAFLESVLSASAGMENKDLASSAEEFEIGGGIMGAQAASMMRRVGAVKAAMKSAGGDAASYIAKMSGMDVRKVRKMLGREGAMDAFKGGMLTADSDSVLRAAAARMVAAAGHDPTDSHGQDLVNSFAVDLRESTQAYLSGDKQQAVKALDNVLSTTGAAAGGTSGSMKQFHSNMEEFNIAIAAASGRLNALAGLPPGTTNAAGGGAGSEQAREPWWKLW